VLTFQEESFAKSRVGNYCWLCRIQGNTELSVHSEELRLHDSFVVNEINEFTVNFFFGNFLEKFYDFEGKAVVIVGG
jgi:hypothetical protein